MLQALLQRATQLARGSRRGRCRPLGFGCAHWLRIPIRLTGDYLDDFFFSDTAPTVIYTLSLHDALPIFPSTTPRMDRPRRMCSDSTRHSLRGRHRDRKSTRLNSSHVKISYAVVC